MADIARIMPELEGEELLFVGNLVKGMTDTQADTFAITYRARRREPMTVLLLTLLGFVGIAGVGRFYLEQIGMGLLYFLTAGFCFIGTIIDVVNYQKLSFEYNALKAQAIARRLDSAGPDTPPTPPSAGGA